MDRMSFRIEGSDKERLKTIADDYDITPSKLMRMLVDSLIVEYNQEIFSHDADAGADTPRDLSDRGAAGVIRQINNKIDKFKKTGGESE